MTRAVIVLRADWWLCKTLAHAAAACAMLVNAPLPASNHACASPAALPQTLVKALILLRNRQQLAPTQLLPLLFRLFRVQDKALRQASIQLAVAVANAAAAAAVL